MDVAQGHRLRVEEGDLEREEEVGEFGVPVREGLDEAAQFGVLEGLLEAWVAAAGASILVVLRRDAREEAQAGK